MKEKLSPASVSQVLKSQCAHLGSLTNTSLATRSVYQEPRCVICSTWLYVWTYYALVKVI